MCSKCQEFPSPFFCLFCFKMTPFLIHISSGRWHQVSIEHQCLLHGQLCDLFTHDTHSYLLNRKKRTILQVTVKKKYLKKGEMNEWIMNEETQKKLPCHWNFINRGIHFVKVINIINLKSCKILTKSRCFNNIIFFRIFDI